MESSLHYLQLLMLVTSLEWLWQDRNDFFIGANLTTYFSRQQLRNRDFRGPDFFLVKHIEKCPRNAWVLWEENGKYPDLVIALLSASTASVDRTLKKDLYQNQFRTPEYFWFSPDDLEFYSFRLVGSQYQSISPTTDGWCWSEVLGLYLGVEENKLRYFTPEGIKVPTPEEAAELQQQLVKQERHEKELAQKLVAQERQRAERLAAQLRSLGFDPDE